MSSQEGLLIYWAYPNVQTWWESHFMATLTDQPGDRRGYHIFRENHIGMSRFTLESVKSRHFRAGSSRFATPSSKFKHPPSMVLRMWFHPRLNRGFWGMFPMIGGRHCMGKKHDPSPYSCSVYESHCWLVISTNSNPKTSNHGASSSQCVNIDCLEATNYRFVGNVMKFDENDLNDPQI